MDVSHDVGLDKYAVLLIASDKSAPNIPVLIFKKLLDRPLLWYGLAKVLASSDKIC